MGVVHCIILFDFLFAKSNDEVNRFEHNRLGGMEKNENPNRFAVYTVYRKNRIFLTQIKQDNNNIYLVSRKTNSVYMAGVFTSS